MKSNFKQWLLGTAWALVACLPLASHAEPYFTNKEGNLIWDKATGLVWMRCSLGQKWLKGTCVGKPTEYTFEGAQSAARDLNSNGGFGGFTDWVVPSSKQLASLIYCSGGGGSNQYRTEQPCNGSYIDPTIHGSAFPGMVKHNVYWTSTPYAWVVLFYEGNVHSHDAHSNGFYARLVRGSPFNGDETTISFDKAVEGATQWAARYMEEQKLRASKEAAATLNNLLAKGPQQLYLLAGQAQRGKYAEVNGKSHSATELYELIVQHFPQSEFAVKASDQLSAMSRSENSARQQRNASAQQCEAQKQTCLAQCPPLWAPDAAGYQCQGRCNKISCD